MPPEQDPRAAIPPRSGGLRNRLRKFVHKRKSLPVQPQYTLPLSQPPPPSRDGAPAGLSVQLSIRYKEPLNINFENTYESSRNYISSDEVCHGLLRRLDHGCPELITRRDSSALTSGKGQKPMRYELTFTVTRQGKLWAVKVYSSYQEHPLDRLAALEVTEEADQLVGPFLKRHDQAFKWQPCERLQAEPATAVPPQGNTVSLVSVPLCRFQLAKQEYESVPGYEISLEFKSQRRPRKPVNWERNLHIKSLQNMPLTLSLGEDLTWKVSSAMTRMLDARRNARPAHTMSDDSDGEDTRAHLAEDSLHVGFRIRNRIGFDYAHLERSTDSRLALFQHPDGLDCEEFLKELEQAIIAARDEVDTKLGQADDLKISVRQVSGLSGTYWTVKNPFAVSLDSSVSYSRHTIQAVLDRVQTGVEDVLHGNDVSISFSATKRGHAVLDKTVVAQSDRSSSRHPPRTPTGPDQDSLISALKERMQKDVGMVIRDTMSLDASDKAPANLRLIERRMDVPVPSPSTLVASSHSEPEEHREHENTMSVDDVITASMAKFAALDDSTSDSGETATRRHSTDETPLRPIPLIKDEQDGTAWPSTRRESITAISVAATDEADTESTRLSTPCFSEREADTTQHDSHSTTPNHSRGASHTFDRFISRPDDASIKSEDTGDMKLPRRFALLSRRRRSKTPTAEAEPTATETTAGKGKKDVVAVEKIELPPVGKAKPPSSETEQPFEAQQQSTQSEAAVPTQSSELQVTAESTEDTPEASSKNVESLEAQKLVREDAASSTQAVDAPVPQATETQPAELKSPQELQACPTDRDEEPIEDAESSVNAEADQRMESRPQSRSSDAEAALTGQTTPELAVDPSPKTPQPRTPVMTTADSSASESPNDNSYMSLGDDSNSRAPPSPALSIASLTLWRPFGSPLVPDDLDLNAVESPSKYMRPSLQPRPQSSHSNAYFARGPSVSPTASPSPARRPILAAHKRQFSSPTAGYLGLLHGRGSPLRMQSSLYTTHALDATTAEEDEDGSGSPGAAPHSPLAQMQRRSSWALAALRPGEGFELAARPSSSAGLPAPGSPMMRGRSGSTLSASIWLN